MSPENKSSHGSRLGKSVLRPTTGLVRNALFSILGKSGVQGQRVLDLYAGTGNLALEALRRGASSADFVEINRNHCKAIRLAVSLEGFNEQTRVYRGKVERILQRLEGRYGLVFIDPPYSENPYEEILNVLGTRDMLNQNATVIAEHDRRVEISSQHFGLHRQSLRRYGDTSVSIYRKVGTDKILPAIGEIHW